jgi:putative ABC transport system permease protein
LISYKDKRFIENLYYADEDIFSVLTFPLERGDPKTALKDPFSIVITPSIAKKYFSDVNPVGKILTYENKYDFMVTGILKEIPQHSHIRPSLIASINTLNTLEPYLMTDDRASGAYFYFTLKNNTSKSSIESKVKKIFDDAYGKEAVGKPQYVLEPLSDVYLYSADTKWDNAEHGDIDMVKSFIGIAFLIILMAAFNYTNLLTAYVKIREKELSIRKLLGAGRRALVKQFLFETILFLMMSLMAAVIMVELLMNEFNQVTNKHLALSSLLQWEIVFSVFILLSMIAFSSVIYPAFIALKSDALYQLKTSTYNSRFNLSRLTLGFRQTITFIQFAITIVLISAAIIIYNQMTYVKNARLGFNKEQLLTIENPYGEKMYDRYQNYKDKITQYPQVISVSASGNVPGENINNYTPLRLQGKTLEESIHTAQIAIDYDLFKTWQAEIISGRDFSKEITSDAGIAVIINRAAADALGLNDAVGIKLDGVNNADWPQKVIGVVENIHFKSFKEEVMPVIFYLRQWSARNIVVRLHSNDIGATLNNLKDEWDKLVPDRPFIYSFVDESFSKLYSSEQRITKLVMTFCTVAVLISAIGLLGLITVMSQMRKKEIGIRKVLGASVFKILLMMIKEYLYIILAANIIAFPVAYYFLNKWLERFVYRIEISYWTFAFAGFIAFLIGLTTITLKVFKTAKENPVDSLKYE